MIKIKDREWKKLKDEEKISFCEDLLNDVRTAREKRDMEWYLNHMFNEGQHYLTYNTVTKSLESNPPRKKGEVRMVVNKVRSSKRAIQNYVTASKPKWETIPGDIDPDTIYNARVSGKFLDYIYRTLHLEQMVTGVVDTGLDKSISFAEIDWDEKAAKGEGQIRVRLHDPWYVWFDKMAYLYNGKVRGMFMAKTVNKPLDIIMSDKRYNEKNRKKVKADDTLAVSNMHAKIIRKEQGPDEQTIKRAIVKEFFLWDEEGNDKGGNIQLFTYAGGQVLRDEPLKDDEYPLIPYQISMNPLKLYQRAWLSDAIPLNKALDRTISQKIMYVNQALRYAIIAEKGHGAQVVSNDMGEILEISKGRTFQQMQVNPLPTGFDAVNVELNQYIEDIMGAHDAALGRLPAGARSGKTLEALQAADSNNLSGLTQSLESFLSVVGERILKIAEEKYVASRIIKLTEPEDGQEYVRVGGKSAPERDGLIKLTGDNEVIVKIGSWLGYTKEAQTENLMKLSELGVIPREEILRQLEFPNIEELSRKAQEQSLEKDRMQMAIAGHAPGQQGGQPGQGGVDLLALADKENQAMANGEQIPPTEGATPDHSQAHRDFILSETFRQLDPNAQQFIISHYQGEVGVPA